LIELGEEGTMFFKVRSPSVSQGQSLPMRFPPVDGGIQFRFLDRVVPEPPLRQHRNRQPLLPLSRPDLGPVVIPVLLELRRVEEKVQVAKGQSVEEAVPGKVSRLVNGDNHCLDRSSNISQRKHSSVAI